MRFREVADEVIELLFAIDILRDSSPKSGPGSLEPLTKEEEEKADALIKRAELSLGVGKRRRRVDQAIEDLTEAMKRRRRVDQAIEDLTEAMNIGERSENGLGLLGECYEWKGMI
ncbi:uncharacterized protein A4U43_C08F10680 [Asparagus officinalis]|nr:uncharacterized protein A4U43_C08F10680 [Asparagus officinalis]